MKPQQSREKFQVQLTAEPVERTLPPGVKRIYKVNCFTAGEPNGWVITPTVLEPAAPMWEGVEVLMDHAGFFQDPSVSRLVGIIHNPAWNGHAVNGELHIFQLKQAEPAIELLDLIVLMKQQGQPAPKVGMSTDMHFTWEERSNKRVVNLIDRVVTTDIVIHPAAGGEVERILFHQQHGGNTMKVKCTKCGVEYDEGAEHTCTDVARNVSTPAPIKPAPQSQAQFANLSGALAQAEAQATTQLTEQCTRLLDLKLSASGLPAPMCDIVRAHFQDAQGGVKVFQPAELDAEIERTKLAHAQMAAGQAIVNMGHPIQGPQRRPAVSGMWDSRERITAAYHQLLGLPVEAQFSDVPRLTGIRELYFHLTGDRELRGIYHPERVQFAVSGATTPIVASTMADITADALSKLALQSWNTWSQNGYNWWRRAVAIRNASTLQSPKWITPAGFADLATVAEGGVYAELTWSDVKESGTFVKKGGYLPLTIEMIDKDDTESWRQVGAYLGTAAIRTLSTAVAAIFTTNAALDQDSVALFSEATHDNLVAYDLDQAGWDAAGQKIFDATEVGSSKTLGLTPDRVLVPREKRRKAIELFYSPNEPGGNLNAINVARLDATKDSDGPVIVVPEWTDVDDWVAMVNPALMPGVGVAFRFGEQPEIFSAAGASDFLLFYQDCLPVKVRYFFAVKAIDYRPMCKSSL